MIKLFVFRSKIHGSSLIVYPAETPQQAYLNLIKDLKRLNPDKDNFQSIKRQINVFPLELKEL